MTKGEQTRQQIIQRAATLFNQRGYTGSSISDVMAATGLQKGGIYRHFGSKEELALAAFDFAQQRYTQRLEQAVQSETHAVKQLLALIDAFHTNTLHPPLPGGCPIFNTMVDSDDGDPMLRQRALAVVSSWEHMIGQIVDRGVQNGTLRPATNAQAVATLLIGAIEGAIVLARIHNDPVYVAHAVQHLYHYVQHEIAQPDA